MKRTWNIKKDGEFSTFQEEVIYDAMEFLESYFDDEKFYNNNLLKKPYKITIEIKEVKK